MSSPRQHPGHRLHERLALGGAHRFHGSGAPPSAAAKGRRRRRPLPRWHQVNAATAPHPPPILILSCNLLPYTAPSPSISFDSIFFSESLLPRLLVKSGIVSEVLQREENMAPYTPRRPRPRCRLAVGEDAEGGWIGLWVPQSNSSNFVHKRVALRR